MIVCGFPGIGKTHLTQMVEALPYGFKVVDSDSSKFPKQPDGVFPENYIEHLRDLDRHGNNIILASTHADVRSALQSAGLDFVTVIPDTACKEEYLQRYQRRGSAQQFIDLLDKQWMPWLTDCIVNCGQGVYVLQQHQYLFDALPEIIRDYRARLTVLV